MAAAAGKIAVGARLVVIANLFGLKRLRRPQINSMELTGNNQNVINLRVDYSIPMALLRLRIDGLLIGYFHF